MVRAFDKALVHHDFAFFSKALFQDVDVSQMSRATSAIVAGMWRGQRLLHKKQAELRV